MSRKWTRSSLQVYLVMGARPRGERSAAQVLRSAILGGVTCFQFREKELPVPQQLAIGRELRAVCREFGVPFLVNDRVDLALLLEADGVHLGQDDIPVPEARRLLGEHAVIGMSAGNPQELEIALSMKPDYLGIGPVYATATKGDAGAPIGTGLIAELRRQSDLPVVGIGGIDASNAGPVLRAGADGVAVVSAIAAAADPQAAAAEIRAAAAGYHH
ncbi:thiamine phosphate synthase [Paenibacillus thermoaerophilus]|uniref:Thiamine-phosphate synthase n=1 Tax=Paenibacillus thermoaerophilus TaxID=1215385 RepID=A0ABW2V4I4_9BACL|nr:thiamine phosphate synthase [Paenibacillus thermoaerophilus]TMV18745.1 thiamine phosphate synthase [Paenibacillus thermoaerophilus]